MSKMIEANGKSVNEQLKKLQEQVQYFNPSFTNLDKNYTYLLDYEVKYEILTANSKESILKKLKKFKELNKILKISFSTNTKYSKIFDKEYTEYNIFIEYL